MKKVSIGIIGTGFTVGIANNHVQGLKLIPECELTALYDIVPGRAAKWHKIKEVDENVKTYDDIDEFFNAVDAVSICTQNDAHIELAEKCLAAGKHVIVEKPLSNTLDEAKKALEFSKKYPHLVSMVVFNYREKPGTLLIKDLVDEGKLGKIFYFRYTIGQPRIGDAERVKLEWRMQKGLSGAGAMADFGCHALDAFHFIVGSKINNVGCYRETFIKERYEMDSDTKKDVTNDDVSVFIARSEAGTLCTIQTSRLGVPEESLDISAEGGTVNYVHGDDFITVRYKPFNGTFTSTPEKIMINEKYNNLPGHAGVLDEFVKCIVNGTKPQRSIEHGVYIQQLLHALEQSADDNTFVEVV